MLWCFQQGFNVEKFISSKPSISNKRFVENRGKYCEERYQNHTTSHRLTIYKQLVFITNIKTFSQYGKFFNPDNQSGRNVAEIHRK
jgi:hypothetical protein